MSDSKEAMMTVGELDAATRARGVMLVNIRFRERITACAILDWSTPAIFAVGDTLEQTMLELLRMIDQHTGFTAPDPTSP